jgi:hypothetical protein
MTAPTPNLAASVHQRLLNQSRAFPCLSGQNRQRSAALPVYQSTTYQCTNLPSPNLPHST